MQRAAGGARNIVGPGQDLCGGVVLAVLDQEIAELRFELHPRVFFEDFLENLRRHLIKAQTQKVETGAEMDQCYLARQPGRYSRRGVQSDRLPNEIRTLRRHPMLRAEIARSIRAIDFKPGGISPRSCKSAAQNAASSSTTGRPRLLTARLPKM